MKTDIDDKQTGSPVTRALLFTAILAGVLATSFHSYLLFHSLCEFFSIVVAGSIFVIAWNGRRIIANTYLLIIGIAFFFIGLIDLMHTLSYTGMRILNDEGSNLPTQLWLAARYLESLTFLGAGFFINKQAAPNRIISLYAVITALLLLSIFHWDIFPVCYVPGSGLTPFKIVSEFVISFFFLLSLLFVVKYRDWFDTGIAYLLMAAIFITILSEWSFTFYFHVNDYFNLAGHLFKLIAFYLLYRAIVETAFLRPYSMLFNEIRQREQQLQRSRDLLERSYLFLKDHAHEQAIELLQTSAELKTTQAEKEQDRKRFYFILENLPAFVYLLDEDHTFHYVNFYFKKQFGDPTGVNCFRLLQDRDKPCPNCRIAKVIETGQAVEWDWLNAPDNRKYHVYSFPFTDIDGSRLTLEMGVDITERIKAELRGRKYAQELEIKNQELREFAYVASHDLQEPLRKIVTFANLLNTEHSAQLDEKGADYLARMENAAIRMRSLIRALLAYSRVSTRKGLTEKVNLTNVVEKAIEDLEDLIKRRNALVTVSELAAIQAAPNQMHQLFQNLISNGIKFNQQPRPKVTVRGCVVNGQSSAKTDAVGSDAAVDLYQILIEDNGIGIEEQYQHLIFMPFQRLHSRNQYEGTGIGLSICQKIVEGHGGNITVTSREGGGSIFTITLPVEQPVEVI